MEPSIIQNVNFIPIAVRFVARRRSNKAVYSVRLSRLSKSSKIRAATLPQRVEVNGWTVLRTKLYHEESADLILKSVSVLSSASITAGLNIGCFGIFTTEEEVNAEVEIDKYRTLHLNGFFLVQLSFKPSIECFIANVYSIDSNGLGEWMGATADDLFFAVFEIVDSDEIYFIDFYARKWPLEICCRIDQRKCVKIKLEGARIKASLKEFDKIDNIGELFAQLVQIDWTNVD
ncbi:hypothetical protein ACOME3_006281 [Neoechinorhynchus agilis]